MHTLRPFQFKQGLSKLSVQSRQGSPIFFLIYLLDWRPDANPHAPFLTDYLSGAWLRLNRTPGKINFGVSYVYDAEVRSFFKLVLSLMAGTVRRPYEGDLREVKEWLETSAA